MRPTRRELAVLAAAGALPLAMDVRGAFARAQSDVDILRAAVDLEQRAVFSYGAAVPRLDGRTARLAEHFQGQEEKHAAGLSEALRNRGGHLPPKPRSARDVPGLPAALSGGRRAILLYAVALEETAVTAYYEAARNLHDPRLLSDAARIIGNESQHLAVLREALGQDPVPSASVGGRR
jgi:rubrerythrin